MILALNYLSQFFSFINVITSFCVVAQASAGEGFAALWSSFMVVAVAIGGTMVFRKYQTEAAVGFLLGVTGMMAQLFFMLFCVSFSFAGVEHVSSVSRTVSAYAAFAFFLMISYAVVALALFVFRSDILPTAPSAAKNNEMNKQMGVDRRALHKTDV